jgi:hypothetical protein
MGVLIGQQKLRLQAYWACWAGPSITVAKLPGLVYNCICQFFNREHKYIS